jgi:Tfp pilus assembly protein PilN
MMEKTAKAEERRRLALKLYEEERTKIPLVFREISQLVSRNIIIRTVNINQGELRIWGTAFEIGDTAENTMSKFVLALSASPYFSDVKMLKASKNNDYLQDAFNFEIIARIVI